MIPFPDMVHEWHEMTDQEQIDFCNVVISEYKRLEKPLHDVLLDGYYAKDDVCAAAILQTHDWRRLRTNLDLYTNHPKGEVNDRSLRYQTVLHMRGVLGLLEFINRYLPKQQEA